MHALLVGLRSVNKKHWSVLDPTCLKSSKFEESFMKSSKPFFKFFIPYIYTRIIYKTYIQRINVSPYVESYLSLARICQSYALRIFILREKQTSSQSHLLFFPSIRIHIPQPKMPSSTSESGRSVIWNQPDKLPGLSSSNLNAHCALYIHNITGKSY